MHNVVTKWAKKNIINKPFSDNGPTQELIIPPHSIFEIMAIFLEMNSKGLVLS